MSSCCVFSTASDSYIPNAVVSLLSFEKHNKGLDKFIITTQSSDENRRLCEALSVTLIEIDLSDSFYRSWDYPKECYYHFKAPEIFLPKGYEYSIYIDGDTYCNRAFDFEIAKPFHIAGASYETNRRFFAGLKELPALAIRFGVGDMAGFDRPRIQTGVLVYHNPSLVRLGYFEKIAALFRRSIEVEIPRKGDDSLLALFVSIHPEFSVNCLPPVYNLIDFKLPKIGSQYGFDALFDRCVIYHFVSYKPWRQLSEPGQNIYLHKYFSQRWLEVMINNFDQEEIKRCYPDIYKSDIIDEADAAFFWWSEPPPNFGDWITPYIVRKVSGLNPGKPLDPSKTDRNVIISTGSIMRLCGPNTIVWGSGIRDRQQDIRSGKLVRSVRGPLTRMRLLEVGGECPPIYGDPGLLLPKFYQPANVTKRYSLGIVPHITQFARVQPLYQHEKGVTVIDLRTADVESIIDQIVSCEKVVSSSLHGIVAANAYGIPVRWIQFDTNIFGDNTKYYDHFRSIGRPQEKFIDAIRYKKVPVKELLDQITDLEIEIDLERLWEASPFFKERISRYMLYQLTP